MTAPPPQAGPARQAKAAICPARRCFAPVPLCTGRKGACCPVKTILCFGDSNTFGYVPGTSARYAREVRWPCRHGTGCWGKATRVRWPRASLAAPRCFLITSNPTARASEHIAPIIAKPCAGRTGGDAGHERHQNALPCVRTGDRLWHGGSFASPAHSIPLSPVPKVVLVSPAPLRCEEGIEFSASSVEKSKQLAPIYAGIARRFGCSYFDAGQFAALGWMASILPSRTTPKWPAAAAGRTGAVLREKNKEGPLPAGRGPFCPPCVMPFNGCYASRHSGCV